MSILDRISYIEPILFLIILAANLQGFTRQALIYQESCRILYKDCTFLQSKSNNTEGEKYKRVQVQKLSDDVLTINSAIMVTTPIISTLLSGIQIDKGRYKLSLSLPIIGASSGCLFLMFIVHYKLNFLILYMSTIVSFFFGSVVVLTQTSFSYITNTSNPKHISSRLIIAEVVIILAVFITNNIGGYLADLKQLDISFLICLVLYIASGYYGLAVIPDIVVPPSDDPPENTRGIFFFKKIFGFLFKKRDSRKLIFLYLICFFISYLTYNSYSAVTYLYLISDPFVMTNKEYAIAISISSGGGFIFGILSSQFLLKENKSGKQRIRDTTYGIITCLSNVIGFGILGFAKKTYMIYIAVAFLSCQTIPSAIMRSILTKLVDPDEKGRLFSIILLLQSLSAVLGNTLGLQVYRYTLTTYPGLIFFILCGLGMSVVSFLTYRLLVERSQD